MAKLIIKHDQAIQMHSEFYDKEFEVVKVGVCGFMDSAIFSLTGGGNWGGWEGLVSTDGEKITLTKGGFLAQGKITQSWQISKNETDDIKQGVFRTKIYCKDKIKGLTTAGLWEWFWRIALFGIGILTYRSKRVEFITRNEFDNIKKFEELLAK